MKVVVIQVCYNIMLCQEPRLVCHLKNLKYLINSCYSEALLFLELGTALLGLLLRNLKMTQIAPKTNVNTKETDPEQLVWFSF